MDRMTKTSIIWVIVLLVEALILKLAKSMRLWIYIALPIIAGFAAMEYLASKPTLKLIKPNAVIKRRNLK